MFDPFAMHVSIPICRILEIAGIQAPMRGLLSGARTVCSILSAKPQCVESGSEFAAWLLGQCALKLSIISRFFWFCLKPPYS